MTTTRLDIPDLEQELRELLGQIPVGRVTTFGDLARALGDVSAARWIAQTVRGEAFSQAEPVHRVVMKSGELGGTDEADLQHRGRLLKQDGIPVLEGRVDVDAFGFTEFESSSPLDQLKRFQNDLPEQVRLEPYAETPDEIAAVDLSYAGDGSAVACYAVVETATGRLAWSATVHRPVRFPYLSGYLSYRELPILLDLIEHVQSRRALADVVFVDGNGRLHPRRAGIATHLGVAAGLRTVGVGKKLLCGRVDLSQVTPDQPRPILDGDELLGQAVKAGAGSRPVFVSPGHQIDVPDAVRLARLLFHGHRLPEPIHQADAISRQEAKALDSGIV